MNNSSIKIIAFFIVIIILTSNSKIVAQSPVLEFEKVKFRIVGLSKNKVDVKDEKRKKIKVSIEDFYIQINIPGFHQGQEFSWDEVKESQSTNIFSEFLNHIEHNNIGFAIGLAPPEEYRIGNNSRAKKISYISEKGIIFKPYIWTNGVLERIDPPRYAHKIVFKAYLGDIIPLKLYVYSYKTYDLKFDPMSGYDEKLIEVKELTQLNLPIEDKKKIRLIVKFDGRNWHLDYDRE